MKRRMPAFALLLLVGTAAVCSAADLYRVAGTVVNAQTGSALPHAEVYVYSTGKSTPVAKLMTDDGRFSFDLPQGSYLLRAGTRTNAQVYGSRNPDVPLGSAVIVGAGHDTAHLAFRWYPPAAIFGRVLDGTGERVEGALVQLVRSSVNGGRRIAVTVRWERTNDLGEYRFGYIPGGARYYLAVTGKPWYSGNGLFGQPEEPSEAFIPLYYPNTPDVTRAAPLTLNSGEEVRADFTLTSVRGSTVTVKHDAPTGTTGMVSLMSEGIAGNDGFQEQVVLPELPPGLAAGMPRFDPKFVGVPPGHYTVQVVGKNGSADLAGRKTIDVNGSDITVELAVHPFATVSGTVHFRNPDTKPPASMLETLVREGNTGTIGALVRPDGSFVFPSVPSGKYRPAIRGAVFVTAGVEVNGVGFRDGLLELSEGDSATISILASDETGRLNGFVMNGDQPAEAVLAVLAPAGESEARAIYRGYQTESDGSFDFREIPAGHYFLFAVDDTAFEYANPAAVKPYLPAAKSVTIEAHGASTERISITDLKAQ